MQSFEAFYYNLVTLLQILSCKMSNVDGLIAYISGFCREREREKERERETERERESY